MARKTKEDYRAAAALAYRLLSNVGEWDAREISVRKWAHEAMEVLRRVVYEGPNPPEARNGWPSYVVNVGGKLYGPFASEYVAERFGEIARERAEAHGVRVGGTLRRVENPAALPSSQLSSEEEDQ